MSTQDIFTIEPATVEEANALQAFAKALKLKFQISKATAKEFLNGSASPKVDAQNYEIPNEHKNILNERLEDYHKNPHNGKNFDKLLESKRRKIM